MQGNRSSTQTGRNCAYQLNPRSIQVVVYLNIQVQQRQELRRENSLPSMLPRPVGRQREVLYLPANGHTVVLGTAGSGKTTLSILRTLYLSDPSTDHCGRTLLVTFNRCLVTYMEHLAGKIQQPVDVRNYHHFARGYLDYRGRLPWGSICRPEERLRFIRLAVARGVGRRRTKLYAATFGGISR